MAEGLIPHSILRNGAMAWRCSIALAGVGFGAGVDSPGGPSGGLQYGYTGATELPWAESALDGFVGEVDERTGWFAFWDAIHDPRAWF
jgi:hypothetical protein